MIRDAKLVVVVTDGRQCASSCFLMFAAARGRVLYGNARIGVHGAAIDGQETPEAVAATVLMAREAARLGVPMSILGTMTTTPASSITWLSRDDLASMEGASGRVLFRPAQP